MPTSSGASSSAGQSTSRTSATNTGSGSQTGFLYQDIGTGRTYYGGNTLTGTTGDVRNLTQVYSTGGGGFSGVVQGNVTPIPIGSEAPKQTIPEPTTQAPKALPTQDVLPFALASSQDYKNVSAIEEKKREATFRQSQKDYADYVQQQKTQKLAEATGTNIQEAEQKQSLPFTYENMSKPMPSNSAFSSPSYSFENPPVRQPAFKDVNLLATLEPKHFKLEQGQVNLQTYAESKFYRATDFLSQKILKVIPEGNFKTFISEKKYPSVQVTTLAKFGAFSPFMATGTETTLGLIKSGSLIPESKTLFYGSVKNVGDNRANFDILSKTAIGSKNYIGIAKGDLIKTSETNTIAGGYGYSISKGAKRGYDVVLSPFLSFGKNVGKAQQTLLSTPNFVALSETPFESFASRTFSNQYMGINFGKQLEIPSSLPSTFLKRIKVNPALQTTDIFGMTKPLNEQGNLFAYVGQTGTLRGLSRGNTDVFGRIFIKQSKSDVSSFVVNKAGRGLSQKAVTPLSNVISNLVESAKTSFRNTAGKTAGLGVASRTSILPLASAFPTPTQSAYYGTGQYETTTGTTSALSNRFFMETAQRQRQNALPSFNQGLITETAQQNKNIFGSAIINQLAENQDTLTRQFQPQIPRVNQAQRQRQDSMFKNPTIPFFPPTLPLPKEALLPPIFKMPKFNFDTGINARGFGAKRKSGYTPSYDALIRNIVGKKPKSIVQYSLGTRPVQRRKGYNAFGIKNVKFPTRFNF